MPSKGKRIEKMVARRTAAHHRLVEIFERRKTGSSKGLTAPGSRNLRKS